MQARYNKDIKRGQRVAGFTWGTLGVLFTIALITGSYYAF